MRRALALLTIVGLAGAAFAAEALEDAKVKLLNDFEVDPDADMFKDSTAKIEVVKEHATSGEHSLKVEWEAAKTLSALNTLPADWSGYKSFKFDLWTNREATFVIRMTDSEGKGYAVWKVPVKAGGDTVEVNLERAGEKMDLSKVSHFWFHLVGDSEPTTGYVDNMRLEK